MSNVCADLTDVTLADEAGGGGKIDHAKYIFYESHDQDHSILFYDPPPHPVHQNQDGLALSLLIFFI